MSFTELPIRQYSSDNREAIGKEIESALKRISSDHSEISPLSVKSFIRSGKYYFSVSNNHGLLFDLNCEPEYVFSQQRINAIAQYIKTHS